MKALAAEEMMQEHNKIAEQNKIAEENMLADKVTLYAL